MTGSIVLEILEPERADELDCGYILRKLYLVRGFYDKLLRLLTTEYVLFYLILAHEGRLRSKRRCGQSEGSSRVIASGHRM
jgi:hypothetical protein